MWQSHGSGAYAHAMYASAVADAAMDPTKPYASECLVPWPLDVASCLGLRCRAAGEDSVEPAGRMVGWCSRRVETGKTEDPGRGKPASARRPILRGRQPNLPIHPGRLETNQYRF